MTRLGNLGRRSVLAGGASLSAAPAFAALGVGSGSAAPTIPTRVDAIYDGLTPLQGKVSDVTDAYNRTALALSRIVAHRTRCFLNLPYGADPAQRLDVYVPGGPVRSERPVFVNFHGGAWRWGYKEWMGLNATPLLASGAVYVSVEYSLAPASRHPTQIDDCSRALAWIHAHIGAFGGDPAKIIIGGHSAGAHLSSLLALRPDRLARFGLPADTIKGCVLASGAYDFRDPEAYGLPQANGFLDDFVGSSSDLADVSPIAWVKGNRVPFFVSWGGNDRDDARLTAPAFVQALAGQPGDVTTHVFPGLDHLWMHIAQQSPKNTWTRTASAWLQRLA